MPAESDFVYPPQGKTIEEMAEVFKRAGGKRVLIVPDDGNPHAGSFRSAEWLLTENERKALEEAGCRIDSV